MKKKRLTEDNDPKPKPSRDYFAEGADAFLAGYDETACPHPAASDEEGLWMDGWNSLAGDEEDA